MTLSYHIVLPLICWHHAYYQKLIRSARLQSYRHVGMRGARTFKQLWHVWFCRGEELLDLIQKPTAKETATVKRFKTEGGPAVREYCPHLTKDDCSRSGTSRPSQHNMGRSIHKQCRKGSHRSVQTDILGLMCLPWIAVGRYLWSQAGSGAH